MKFDFKYKVFWGVTLCYWTSGIWRFGSRFAFICRIRGFLDVENSSPNSTVPHPGSSATRLWETEIFNFNLLFCCQMNALCCVFRIRSVGQSVRCTVCMFNDAVTNTGWTWVWIIHGMILTTEVFGVKPVPVSYFKSHILLWLLCDRTRTSTVIN
jgi:hypothetical protein